MKNNKITTGEILNNEDQNILTIKFPILIDLEKTKDLLWKCTNCNENVILRLEFPWKNIGDNYEELPTLNSNFHSTSELEHFHNLLPGTNLKNTNNITLLTNLNYHHILFPPVNLLKLTCKNCNSKFLIEILKGIGSSGEKDTMPQSNNIYIYQIVEFHDLIRK